MKFTDEMILASHAKLSQKITDSSALFNMVCDDVLGYTPVREIVLDMTEFYAFESRYKVLIG